MAGPLGVGPEQGPEAGGRGKRRDAGDGDAGDRDVGRGRKDNAPERERDAHTCTDTNSQRHESGVEADRLPATPG